MFSLRGTHQFKIEVSNDLETWETAVEHGFLQSAFHMECEVPLQTFKSKPVSGRYIKFTVLTFYKRGGGLQFFTYGGDVFLHWTALY